MTAVCLCHSADGPVIRRVPTTGVIKQYRDPRPGELETFTERRLDFMDALLIPADGLTRVLTPADLAAAKAANRPALIGTIEGCHFMEGKLERVEEVYRRGIRQLQIVHYMPSVARGSADRAGEVERPEPARRRGDPRVQPPRHRGRRGPRHLRAGRAGRPGHLGAVHPFPHCPGAGAAPALHPADLDRARAPDRPAQRLSVRGCPGLDRGHRATGRRGGRGPRRDRHRHEVWANYADLPAVADRFLKQGFSPEEASKVMGGNYVRVFTKAYETQKAS